MAAAVALRRRRLHLRQCCEADHVPFADLVLIEGAPMQRIADIRRATLVWKAGTVYEPAALYEAMGRKPFVRAARIERVNAAR